MNIEALIKDHAKKSRLLKKALKKLKHKAKNTISIKELEQLLASAKGETKSISEWDFISNEEFAKMEAKVETIEEIINYIQYRFESKLSNRHWLERIRVAKRKKQLNG